MSRNNREEPDFDKARREAADLGMPDLGMTDMDMADAEMHEIFMSKLKAGFTPAQALYIVGCMLTGTPGHPPPR